jgi:Glycosyl transferases group 1
VRRVGVAGTVTRPHRLVATWAVNERPPPTNQDPFRAKPTFRVPQLRTPWQETPLDGPPAHVLAFVHGYVPAHGSGAEHMLHALLRDSVRRGHRATVMCANAGPPPRGTGPYEVDGVQVVGRPQLPAALADADLMIGHLAWTNEVVVAAADHQIPLVYICHNDRQLQYWRSYLKPQSVTVTVWNSQWVADKLTGIPGPHWAGGWPGPGAVIRPPCLLEDYRIPTDPPANGFVTLVNVQRPKGSTLFYALAARPPSRRWLAVEGAYGSQVHPGSEHPHVAWQPQTGDMRGDVYARTRVLLVPSEYESWGRCAVEAMAAGIPVIAHPTPGLRESLGDAAIFVELEAGIEAWQAALELLDDARTYRRWSSRARDRAQLLDEQSRGDLDTWDRVIRACASAGRVSSAA